MPYNVRKQKCTQSDGDKGTYVLKYTTKKGKKVSNCHTSKKKAQGQIAAIEGPRESTTSSTGKRNNMKLKNILKEKGKGLWANIAAKKKRGEKSDPRSKSYKAAKKAGQKLNRGEGIEEIVVRKEDQSCFFEWLSEYSKTITEAEYKGKKVELGKVKRGGDKKFYVYAKNPKTGLSKGQM